MKIYTNVEVVPSRVLALVKFLGVRSPLNKDALCAYLQPREDRGMAQKVVDAADEIGLIEEGAEGWKLTPAVTALPLDEDDNRALRRMLGRVLLEGQVAGNRNGFALLTAWFLSLEFAQVPDTHAGLKTALEADGFSTEDLQVRTDLRWDNVLYWTRFLGLTCRLGDTVTGMLVPDPTEYLQLHLDAFVAAGEEVRIGEFHQRLAAYCPVLDGGKVRAQVLAQSPRRFPTDTLSPALSFGLTRLESRGLIKLSSPPDERSVLHLGDGQRRVAFVSRRS